MCHGGSLQGQKGKGTGWEVQAMEQREGQGFVSEILKLFSTSHTRPENQGSRKARVGWGHFGHSEHREDSPGLQRHGAQQLITLLASAGSLSVDFSI